MTFRTARRAFNYARRRESHPILYPDDFPIFEAGFKAEREMSREE